MVETILVACNQLTKKITVTPANSTPNLVLDGEVDEVGVHNHPIRRPERRVVAEEQSRRDLRPAQHKPKRHNQPKQAYQTETKNQNANRHSHIAAELLLLGVLLVGVQHILLVPVTEIRVWGWQKPNFREAAAVGGDGCFTC